MSFTINELHDALKYHNHAYEMDKLEILELAKKEIEEKEEEREDETELKEDYLNAIEQAEKELDAYIEDLEKLSKKRKTISIEEVKEYLIEVAKNFQYL